MANTTETREVSMKELAQAFEGKYINVSSVDHYGIAIDEDVTETIEESNGIYTISFSIDMADVDISEYKSLKRLQKERDEKTGGVI